MNWVIDTKSYLECSCLLTVGGDSDDDDDDDIDDDDEVNEDEGGVTPGLHSVIRASIYGCSCSEVEEK